jgi:hypothetical protein
MAADAWVVHDKFKEYLGDGTVDMDADNFKMALALSASNIATTSVDGYAAVTSEHANANGYTTGGAAITLPTWIESSGTVTFDCDNVVWTASGGSITAHFAFIYDDAVTTPVADPVVCHSLLDNTAGGTDVTATDGNTFTVAINAAGVFALS